MDPFPLARFYDELLNHQPIVFQKEFTGDVGIAYVAVGIPRAARRVLATASWDGAARIHLPGEQHGLEASGGKVTLSGARNLGPSCT